MPLRPDLRAAYYGPAWRAYRAELIARHGSRCTKCGREAFGRRIQLAHLLHNPRTGVVALMCATDHGRYDALHSRAVARRTIARKQGQLWLLPEIEWAPFPLWMVPRQFRESGQMNLTIPEITA
jgi:hypothetical protein